MLSHSTDADLERFLHALANEAQNQTSGQFSMYILGEQIGLDREAASRTAEELMAQGWVEIRTLAGDIGITEAGLEKLAQSTPSDAQAPLPLASGPVLDDTQRAYLEKLIAEIKVAVAALSFDFETLAEGVADLRTLDAQLASPRPKTAVLCAVLEGLSQCLAGKLAPQLVARINALIV
ncbi:MAG: hypothetical protein WBG37_20605 [Desulfobacterales bacterium]